MPETCYFVIPCYNEAEALPQSVPVFINEMSSLIKSGLVSKKSRILFIDDGSSDSTWEIIETLHSKNKMICGIRLARNSGHEAALYCGLLSCRGKCDFAISMDADLQDDVSVVVEFVKKHYDGAKVVFGIRKDRSSDSPAKRWPAMMFYSFMRHAGIRMPYNHADYRLMAKEPLEALAMYGETNLFLRGVVYDLGFRQDYVCYTRNRRVSGETKYSFHKLVALAWESITSFSVYPIRLISFSGFAIAFVSAIMFLFYFTAKFIGLIDVSGYASIICSIWLLGGLQLLAIGVIGEYIGKTYMETKHRPRYIVEKTLE